MKEVTINEDLCPVDSCATASDSASQELQIRPGFYVLCSGGSLTFSTYLVSAAGEVKLQTGIEYSCSDGSILDVNSGTGTSVVLGTGQVTVTVTWEDKTATATVVCQDESGDCCAATQVRIMVLGDESKDMQQDIGFVRRRDLTYAILQKALAGPLVSPPMLNDHTQAGTILFSDASIVYQTLTDDGSSPIYPLTSSSVITPGLTNISEALEKAIAVLAVDPGDRQVIILFSNGVNRPALSHDDALDLLFTAEEFRQGGGVIICFGIGAVSEGFDLLRSMATPGYFVNIIPPLAVDVVATYGDKLSSMLCGLCAGDLPTTGYSLPEGYSYGCTLEDNGPQAPDPHDYGDIENGIVEPAIQILPKLPCPEFSPPTGAHIGAGLDVFLSVPGHEDAFIRYTADETEPPDPSFTVPSSALDYDGAVPVDGIQISPTQATIKAIARKAGYADSDICEASYIA